jgi:hypothetical protein
LKSLQRIAKEEALENTSNVLSDSKANVDLNQIDGNKASTTPPPLLKLKIRNTTKTIQY